MTKDNSPIGASSATYRKAVNKLAKKLKRQPSHSKYPSSDFEEIVEYTVSEVMKEKALQWYEMGIKRGMAKATDMMLFGKIYKKNEEVFAPDEFTIKVKTRFSGEDWERHEFLIKSEDIGFDI